MTTTVKKNDKLRLRWQVTSERGVPQDLEGAEVKLLLRRRGADGSVLDKGMIVENADQGLVYFQNDGSLEVGIYDMEIEVTKGTQMKQTSPTNGYALLHVMQDLG